MRYINRTLILLGSLIFTFAYGQQDYIVTKDSAYQVGTVQKLNNNQINFKYGLKTNLYSADQIREFSLSGDLYRSFYLENSFVFAKELTKGNMSLYLLRPNLILKWDDKTQLLNKHNFQSVLSRFTDYDGLKFLDYKSRSIQHLVNQINNGDKITYIPAYRIGVVGGSHFYKMTLTFNDFGQSRLVNKGHSFLIGAFIDLPFYRHRSLSFSSEINLSRSIKRISTTPSIEAIQVNSLTAPVAIKWYTIWKSGLRTFVKPGIVPGIHRFMHSESASSLTSVAVGYQASFGVEFDMKSITDLHLELRYQNAGQVTFGNEYYSMKYCSINLLGAFCF